MFSWIGEVTHRHKRVTHVQKDDGKEEDLDNSSPNSIKRLKKFCRIAMVTKNFVSYCIIEEVKEVWEEK